MIHGCGWSAPHSVIRGSGIPRTGSAVTENRLQKHAPPARVSALLFFPWNTPAGAGHGNGAIMSDLTLIATSAFGLESVVGDELKRLVDGKPRVRDGRLEFDGNWHDVARCNLRLRCADRLLWKIAEFTAHDFGELFEQTKAIRWEDLLPRDAVMHVTGNQCARSCTAC